MPTGQKKSKSPEQGDHVSKPEVLLDLGSLSGMGLKPHVTGP